MSVNRLPSRTIVFVALTARFGMLLRRATPGARARLLVGTRTPGTAGTAGTRTAGAARVARARARLFAAGAARGIAVVVFVALTAGFHVLLVRAALRAAFAAARILRAGLFIGAATARCARFALVGAVALLAALIIFLVRGHVSSFKKSIQLGGSKEYFENFS